MFKIRKNNSEISSDLLVTTIWKSSVLAVIFVVRALSIFLGIYYSTGNLIIAAVIGFGIHFVTLAFSGRISKWLVNIRS